jgi:hypothetical protein
MSPEAVRFQVIWFEDCHRGGARPGRVHRVADLGNTDKQYWARFDRKGWRNSLKGRVAMSDEDLARGDADWVRLAVFPSKAQTSKPIELWFDLEDGIVFRCTAATLAEVAALIHAAAKRAGLTLSAEWPGCVSAMQTQAGASIPADEELRPLLEAAGFEWRKPQWRLAVPQRVH